MLGLGITLQSMSRWIFGKQIMKEFLIANLLKMVLVYSTVNHRRRQLYLLKKSTTKNAVSMSAN